PADNAERLAFAELCRQPSEGRYALAARLYAEAFDADPKLASDLRAATRPRAAAAAAAAGCGQGRDIARLDATEKGRLRGQALTGAGAGAAGGWKGGGGRGPGAPPRRSAGVAGVAA